ncbi:MAG: transposase [Planctomycetota bacterium]
MPRSSEPDAFVRWSRLIDLHAQSDLTIADFCDSHGVSTASFYQWRRRIRDRNQMQQSETPGRFLAVQVDPPQPAPQHVTVRFPCGTRIELDGQDSQNIQLVVDRLAVSAARTTP